MLKSFNLKIIVKITGIVLIILCIVGYALITSIDRTPSRETEYYRNTIARIKQLPSDTSNNSNNPFKAGWCKVNITPDEPIPLAGFGLRKKYTSVRDSIWARTFVFDDGSQKVALVTLDLLIVPPAVVIEVKKKLKSSGVPTQQIFYSATHTHNSAGGWAEKVGGIALGGFYNQQYVNKISEAIIQSIIEANKELEPASIGFARYNSAPLLHNRIVGKEGIIDPWLNIIKVRKASGATGIIATFSAHATYVEKSNTRLTRDYPGMLVDKLERSSAIDFAAFCSGAVGSHAPRGFTQDYYSNAGVMADILSHKVLQRMDEIVMEDSIGVKYLYIPIHLREPHLKVSKELRFRPWVFYSALGKYEVGISILRLGDIVMVGTPSDFSGELTHCFEKAEIKRDLDVIVTSFNGGYIGYITNDKHYNLPHHETHGMNWFGPYNGAYFTEVIEALIKKI